MVPILLIANIITNNFYYNLILQFIITNLFNR